MSARSRLLTSVLVYGLVLVWAAAALPDQRVPLHFDTGGSPDRLGTRTEAVGMFAAIGLGVGAAMAGLAWLVGSARLPFGLVNVPHKDYWVRHQDRARAMVRDDTATLGAMTMGLLCATALGTVAAAGGGSVGPWLWGALLLYLVLVAAWLVRMLTTRYRPPQEA